MRGTKKVDGHVLSVRLLMMSKTSSGKVAVHPSAICNTGPNPLIRFRRHMVTGIPALVRNCEEYPPPRIYSSDAGYQVVALSIFSTSSSLISQKGFITGLPFSSDC